MITTAELAYTIGFALVVLMIAAVYGLRLAINGRARFDRVERQGGSRLLGKRAMELCHWTLEPVAKILAWVKISPNGVSWGSLGFGFLAGACLAWGHFGFGAIFATISGLLDCLDGMVARISGRASDAGEVLDAAVDRYSEFFFLSGLVIYYRAIPALQVLALLALLGSFMVSYSTSKAEALGVDPPKGSMRRPERAVYLAGGAALSALTIAWFEGRPGLPIAIGYPMVVALGLVALVANISAIGRLFRIAKSIRARGRSAEACSRPCGPAFAPEREASTGGRLQTPGLHPR